MPSKDIYKRGQVEAALWNLFNNQGAAAGPEPRIFSTRIKRLLDIDRQRDDEKVGFAFIETAPGNKGQDISFSAFNTFCLAIALDLLDAGFKQSEVVFLMRHIRGRLQIEFEQIMKHPPPVGNPKSADDAPNKPSYREGKMRYADYRVFVAIQKVEFTEVFPALKSNSDKKEPVIFQPNIYHGIEDLTKDLNKMDYGFRKTMLLEIAYTAARITEFLKEAPITKRGRK